MLDALFSAPAHGAQLNGDKFCIDCEAALPERVGSGASSPRCYDCRKKHRRVYEMERYYRLHGRDFIAGAGSIGTCEDCGQDIVKTRADNVVCKTCAQDRLNSYNRQIRETKRRDAGIPVRSGALISCEKCGDAFIKNAWNQKYCPGCKNEPCIKRAKMRKAEDHVFALNHTMSSSIRKALARGKGGYSWEALVGYTLQDLVAHLERQFLPGMTWDNRGRDGWHIDHIVPLSAHSYSSPDDEDFKAAWSLTNLRPLWAEENLRKKDKRLFLI